MYICMSLYNLSLYIYIYIYTHIIVVFLVYFGTGDQRGLPKHRTASFVPMRDVY